MRVVAATPTIPPSAPHPTSKAFHSGPSCEPRTDWTISIAPEYAATSSAPRNTGRALGASALSAVNATSAKAAMLYALRSSTCHDNAAGDVTSYTTSLVAAQNSAAAVISATMLQAHLDFDPGDVL